MAAELELHKLEISARPGRTWSQTLNGFLFVVMFDLGCIMMNCFQFFCMIPLWLLPFASAKRMYDAAGRMSKGSFAVLLSEL